MGTPVALVVAGNLAPATDLCDRRKPSEPDDARVSHNLGLVRQWKRQQQPSSYVPKLLCPTPVGCSASGLNGVHRYFGGSTV